MLKPTIALADDFLDAFSRIPQAQQKKVREFTQKFRENPQSAAINFEKIHGVRDNKVRTVRIDQKYRAVILQPDQGNVYVLAWVDNHDEAMAWAKNKLFEINPATGALQVINVSEAEGQSAPKKKSSERLFDAVEDPTLLSLGVPAVLLPAIRAVADKSGLLDLSKHLPAEAAEGLAWLSEGIPPDEIKDYLSQKPPKEINTADFATALNNPDSRRRFVTISTESDLDKILDAPLEKWRVFLHPSQEELVRMHFNGPARVLGGAGTGKTVVAMHRTRHLARDIFVSPHDRILFTTFTANLAKGISRSLKRLCGPEFERIEVLNLHAVAARILKANGIEFKAAEEDAIQRAWDDALLLADGTQWDTGFVRQEWNQIVQTHGITTEAAYLKVPRTGRGKTLTRPQRAQLWKVFQQYREQLSSQELREWISVISEARQLVEAKPKDFRYNAVVVDEAQDFHPEEWKLIRALAPAGPNDLFIVGDAHQRIYGQKVTLGRCGIQIQGRSRKLRINYRTTEQIRAWADAMLAGVEVDDLDGSVDQPDGYRSLLSGPTPQIEIFKTASGEQQFLEKILPELIARHGESNICLVTRTNKSLKEYGPVLKKLKIRHVSLDKDAEEDETGVRLATMHRVKGLEFPCMILAGMNAKVMPLALGSSTMDSVTKAEHESKERSLLFVAATRARDKLLITTSGTPSPFIVGGR